MYAIYAYIDPQNHPNDTIHGVSGYNSVTFLYFTSRRPLERMPLPARKESVAAAQQLPLRQRQQLLYSQRLGVQTAAWSGG